MATVKKTLKAVDKSKKPGLAKLPTEVRNKMGYQKNGGKNIKKAQDGMRESISMDKTGKTQLVSKTNTKDGPRYYKTISPNESSARTRNMFNIRNNSADSVRAKDVDPIDLKKLSGMKNGGKAKSGKQMMKRADGSSSPRGLWDNIRAAKGSGKKPTAAMLKQEKKIKAKSKK
jgi:hypothetical protein